MSDFDPNRIFPPPLSLSDISWSSMKIALSKANDTGPRMASVALVEIGSAGWLDNEISENDIFTYTPDASTVNATSVRWVYEWEGWSEKMKKSRKWF